MVRKVLFGNLVVILSVKRPPANLPDALLAKQAGACFSIAGRKDPVHHHSLYGGKFSLPCSPQTKTHPQGVYFYLAEREGFTLSRLRTPVTRATTMHQ